MIERVAGMIQHFAIGAVSFDTIRSAFASMQGGEALDRAGAVLVAVVVVGLMFLTPRSQ